MRTLKGLSSISHCRYPIRRISVFQYLSFSLFSATLSLYMTYIDIAYIRKTDWSRKPTYIEICMNVLLVYPVLIKYGGIKCTTSRR
ncbi:hypothetical protein B0H66DRAFT_548133 [Apodospora peruviana]|uniref:Uncharacterized protein n=1 Tax=Apodospora peruviana TaxID=516989 RepID=A0AAE0MBW2_9PEZI|nr:hypothetical protein B0H66DRAFT_548133 [Apodospora peruviana]